ncbi:MAG: DUF1476 domain-containing protein [Alphaproteobacteria bacterium]|nr:DUF1476 domain-containing protein [Alphaproteobacteria bacterium]
MSTFDDRKKAEEARQALKEELCFKAEARRNKLIGLWAAERMGHADPAAYAREVVVAALELPGDDDIAGKVLGDLEAAGQPITLAEFHKLADAYFAVAQEQVMQDVKG